MTLDEAKAKADLLSKLNLEIWNTSNPRRREEIRIQFRSTWNAISMCGFKILRGKKYDPARGYSIPTFRI